MAAYVWPYYHDINCPGHTSHGYWHYYDPYWSTLPNTYRCGPIFYLSGVGNDPPLPFCHYIAGDPCLTYRSPHGPVDANLARCYTKIRYDCGNCWEGYPIYPCHSADCPPGQYWCDGECITPDPDELPPCMEELDCYWDETVCDWVCDPPQCPGDKVWDDHTCSCIPACPEGQCYCAATSPPGCVSCSTPLCAEALHCEWNPAICNWTCDNPATRCGGASFNFETCSCPGGGPCNLVDRYGRYHTAQATENGIRYRRSDHSTPPYAIDVLATDNSADRDPHVAQVGEQRLAMVFTRGTGLYEVDSDADGSTWGAAALLREGASLGVVEFDELSQTAVRAWVEDGTLRGNRQGPGETTPGVPFTFQVDSGAGLLPLEVEAEGFDLKPAGDEEGHWLLFCKLAGATVFSDLETTDDCGTWKEIA
ncbi:MAG TPA: hypothetical protein VK689_05690 [Armatimonadota bacterium]|nr:hypothetical protein [Armatimonadota bacterium]